MATFQNAERDAEDLAKLVNENTLVTTRYDANPKKSWNYLIDEKDAAFQVSLNGYQVQVDNAIDKIAEYAPRVVGDFTDGFTFTNFNEVGRYDDGLGNPDSVTYWSYNGALPFTVPPATVPTSPTYNQRSVNDHGALINRNDVGAHEASAIQNEDLSTSQDTHSALKAILQAQGLSGNFGFFADGFIYNNVGDVGIDTSGNVYTYIGASALPVIIPASTNPDGNGDYKIYTNNIGTLSTQSAMSNLVFDMHQQVQKNTGVNTGDYLSSSVQSVGQSVTAGSTSLTVASNQYKADQLIFYVGDDGEYYSAKVLSAGETFTIHEPLEADVSSGNEVGTFYKDVAHPSVGGYRAIADRLLRNYVFYDKTFDLRSLRYTAVAGSVVVTEDASDSVSNSGSSLSPSIQVNMSSIGSILLSDRINLKGGPATLRLTINTFGDDVRIRVQDNDEIALFAYDETINTNHPTLIEIPLFKKTSSDMKIRFDSTLSSQSFNFKLIGCYKPIASFNNFVNGTHVLHGDSWFAQEGIFERLQARMPNAKIINNGVGGRTSANLRLTVYTELEQLKPDYVHVIAGTNDALTGAGVSTSGFMLNMNLTFAYINSIGARAICYTPSCGGSDQIQWFRFSKSYLYSQEYFSSAGEDKRRAFTLSFSDVTVPANDEAYVCGSFRVDDDVIILDAYASGVNNINFGYSTGISVPVEDVNQKSGNSLIPRFTLVKSNDSDRFFTVSCVNTTASEQVANGFVTFSAVMRDTGD